jgi:hypothetical protein
MAISTTLQSKPRKVTQGFLFPLQLSDSKNILTDYGNLRTKRLMAAAILTSWGERQDDPRLGMVGTQSIFRTMDESTRSFLRFVIKDILTSYFDVVLTGIEFELIDGREGEQIQIIKISYYDPTLESSDGFGVELFRL